MPFRLYRAGARYGADLPTAVLCAIRKLQAHYSDPELKVVVFARDAGQARELAEFLTGFNVPSVWVATRALIKSGLEAFAGPATRVLVVSTSSDGWAVDKVCDVAFLLDYTDERDRLTKIARVHRLGNRRPVTVVDFTTKPFTTVVTQPLARAIDYMTGAEDTDNPAERALTLLVSGFDTDLQQETRKLAIEAAEQALADDEILTIVRARLLGRPLPPEARASGVLAIAGRVKAKRAIALYTELFEVKRDGA